jgi:hypothetical protein
VTATLPLLPRYRRPLTFGGVLDETFRLYRGAWARLMAVSAVASLPGGLAVVALSGQTYALTFQGLGEAPEDPEALARLFTGLGLGTLLASLVYGIGALVGQGGVTTMTGWLMRGEDHSIWEALGAASGRLLAMIGASIVYGLGMLGLLLLAAPLLLVGLGGVLGGLIAFVGLIVWVNRPKERRGNGLKWLIILATPFGLPLYYGVRWSLFIPALMLEGAGAVESLRRSATMVDRRWFEVFGVWVVLGIVVAILQTLPSAAIAIAGAIVGATSGDPGGAGLAFGIANNAATIIGTVLFGALSFIAATIMFVDARNRREGADLAERLDLIEA